MKDRYIFREMQNIKVKFLRGGGYVIFCNLHIPAYYFSIECIKNVFAE